MKKVIIKQGREKSIIRRHPWVFSGAIRNMEGNPAEGELVDVIGSDGQFLARGHYQPDSISVRILTHKDEPVDSVFYARKIREAYNLRKNIGLADNPSTSVYRLIHGEGDGLPGLIVDIYNDTAVMQCHSYGMYLQKDIITESLFGLPGDVVRFVYDKSSATLPFKCPEKPVNSFLGNTCPTELEVLENGNKFLVDIESGQKTGFFIDQRDSRLALQSLAKGRSVANLFSYSGGFSVYALQGGARLVNSVDSSEKAVALADRNAQINGFTGPEHQSLKADVFDFLISSNEKYDIIVLDPPAFAKHNSALDQALQGYRRINAKAMKMIEPGGLLFTFSCSQVVTMTDFRKMVYGAAVAADKEVKVLYRLAQPPDHPVSVFHPEGEYLKGLVLAVY